LSITSLNESTNKSKYISHRLYRKAEAIRLNNYVY